MNTTYPSAVIKKENTMKNVIVSEYVTMDGVMEEPGTWSFP